MDALIAGLVNAGGMGLLAAALFVLHRDALTAFRQELDKERNAFRLALLEDRVDRASQFATARTDFLGRYQEMMGRFDRLETGMGLRRPPPHIEVVERESDHT